MKSLLIISFSDIRSDARVLKQVAEFSQDFEVTTCSYGDKPEGATHHISIPENLVHWAYPRLEVVTHQYHRAYWDNPVVRFARRALYRKEFDAVLANDLDPVPLALSLNSVYGVHADLHEYSPREKEDVRRWRLFVAPFRSWLCRTYLPRCASATTVSLGIAREYEDKFGVAMDVSANATPYHDLKPTPVGYPMRLVYSGACLRDRDPVGMVRAVEAADIPVTLDLYLTPNDPGLLAKIKEMALTSGKVRVHDPVPYSQLVQTLNAYDVGVSVLPPVNFNHQWALPNKFFDYVQARLGVIVGPSPEMVRIVDREGFGAVMKGFSPSDLTDAVNQLTPELIEEWKAASDRAAESLASTPQVLVWRQAIDALVGTSRA